MDKKFKLILNTFAAFGIIYWVILTVVKPSGYILYDLFVLQMGFLPLLGFAYGMHLQNKWGGTSSHVGRAITLISTSLLMWFLGLAALLYYLFSGLEIPYPGLPDYPWVLIDPFYALALVSIMRFSGASRSIKSSFGYLLLLLVPLFSLVLNFYVFFGDSNYFEVIDLAVIFDMIYTFGSVFIMTLIVITTVLSMNKLGGKMRNAIYLLFVGIVFQYAGDVLYSILSELDQIYSANLSDFIYFLSITFIIQGIMNLNPAKLMPKQTENVE